MPVKSAKQFRLMEMVSHGGKMTNSVGPSKEVADEFLKKTSKKKKSLFAKSNK